MLHTCKCFVEPSSTLFWVSIAETLFLLSHTTQPYTHIHARMSTHTLSSHPLVHSLSLSLSLFLSLSLLSTLSENVIFFPFCAQKYPSRVSQPFYKLQKKNIYCKKLASSLVWFLQLSVVASSLPYEMVQA